MGISMKCKWLVIFAVVLALAFNDRKAAAARTTVKVFDVTDYGAKGDGKPIYDENDESINGLHIIHAWRAACEYTKGPSKVLIPNGTFVVAQTHFAGPCKSGVTIELQGTIVPDPDVSQFPNALLLNIQEVDGLTLTGPGYIDAKIRGPPTSKDSDRDIFFFSLMPLITIYNATNVVVDGINGLNPAAFHVLVVLSRNITIQNVRFDADVMAPQSDTSGVYISDSTQVTVSNSSIRTGDNCIIIAPGSNHVDVNRVTCLSGQGISIGADPIDEDVLDVKNVTVRNCTFKETLFGVSLFPRPQAIQSRVSNIIFEDLVMDKVNHSIVIHQQMHPRPKKFQGQNRAIQVKVKDVSVRNITGTTTSRFGVTISCNPHLPCEHIEVAGVNLKFMGKSSIGKATVGLSSNCSNAQVLLEGSYDRLSCGNSIVEFGI